LDTQTFQILKDSNGIDIEDTHFKPQVILLKSYEKTSNNL